MGFGATTWVGVNYDVSGGEGPQYAIFSRHNNIMRGFKRQIGVEIHMHLNVEVGARSARAQLVDVAQLGICGHELDDLRANLVWQFLIHQLSGRFAENLDGAPKEQSSDHNRRQRVQLNKAE